MNPDSVCAGAPIAIGATRSGNGRFPVYVGIGVGGPPRQGGGPNLRRSARRDSRARPDRARRGGNAGVNGTRRDERRDHDCTQARFRADCARHDPPDRLRRSRAALRRRRMLGDGLLRAPVARHRARRRSRVRRVSQPGRRRPGPDVRLRVRRDACADAVPDLVRAPAGAAAERSAQGWPPAVAAAGRQIAGDGTLCQRPARSRSTPSCCPPSTIRA